MKKAFVCGAAVICALCLAGCGLIPTYGSGVIASKTYDLSGFTAVNASAAVEVSVTVVPEAAFSVTASCDDNLIDYLQVSVANGVLSVGGFTKNVSSWYGAKVSVVMPALSGISASSASKVSVPSLASAGTLDIDASSASKIEIMELTADAVDIDISSGSSVELAGTANSLNLDVSSSSHAYLYGLPAVDAVVVVTSASGAEVSVSGNLSGSVSSASSVKYKGGCACTVEVEDVSCSCSPVAG